MAATTGSMNGTPVVFNNMLLSVNGETDNGINGYITDFNWTTGSQTEWVQTMNPQAEPITTNSINCTPRFTMNFAPNGEKAFYAFLGDRWTKFTLLITYYVTGNLEGETKTLLIQNAQQDDTTGGGGAMRPANFGGISFKATHIGFV